MITRTRDSGDGVRDFHGLSRISTAMSAKASHPYEGTPNVSEANYSYGQR